MNSYKKLNNVVENLPPERKLDELYWLIGKKGKSETRENVYIITMISREPRMIVGFDVAYDKSREKIQNIVDSSPEADVYYTDEYLGYIDVVYPGKHIRNVRDKKDTHNVESINANLRHYIPLLARRSRCFARKLDTLYSVVAVFVDAYNRFGMEKHKFRQRFNNCCLFLLLIFFSSAFSHSYMRWLIFIPSANSDSIIKYFLFLK